MSQTNTDHANKDIASSVDGLGGCGVETQGQEPAQHGHHGLHHPQVVQHRDDGAEEHDHRQQLQHRVKDGVTPQDAGKQK